MFFCEKSIIYIVKCFLLCHTFSYHCTAIIVGLFQSVSFKHALNIIPSKNLTYFNKTPIIQHKASILKEFYAMPPDSFRTERHDSHRFLREHPQENQDYNHARSRSRRRCRFRYRRRQVPFRRRRAPSADPTPPLAPAAEAPAAPPEKLAPQLKAAKGSALLSGAGPRDD